MQYLCEFLTKKLLKGKTKRQMQYRRRYTILFALLMCCMLGLWAVPAKRTSIIVGQPDGTQLVLTQCGDEHFHYLMTSDGIPVIRKGEAYYYAISGEDGIESSDLLAHETAQRTLEEQAFVEQLSDTRQTQAEQAKRAIARRNVTTRGTTSEVPAEGEVRIPVLLVQFADVRFSSADPQNAFKDRINGENYTAEGGCGSIREYFIDQSEGQFSPQFDIIGPITLSNNMEYYGGNDKQGTDLRPREMVKEACRNAYNDKIIDFSQYDNNNDGYVDILYIIYAGFGEASFPDKLEDCIWPHQWELGTPLTLDGKKINRYACNNELDGHTGTELDGIGTFCHEFSHCLGLPDFYDTSSEGTTFGMNVWSVMDYGCYNNNGHTPCGYTAYEKDFLGWRSLTELNTPTHVTLKPLSDGGEAYKIVNEANPDEFYVVEYYSKSGWNTYAPADGMLITHVDYLESAWYENIVNNDPKHPRVTIIPADGKLTAQSVTSDTYPGPSRNTKLTATSTPASMVYTGGYMNKDITNIASENGIVTFDFMEGAIQSPRLHSPTNILSTSFTVTWNPVEEVDSYDVRLDLVEENSQETMVHVAHTKECHHTFEGLDAGVYRCRVRSIKNEFHSNYSNPVQVTLTDTILPSIGVAPRIFIRNDSIFIEGPDSATIHYTIDGSYPTTYAPVYTIPFRTTKKITIKAIAHREGYRNTSVAQLTNWFAIDGATYRITSTEVPCAVVSESPEGNGNGDYCGHYTFGETIGNDTITYILEGIETGAFRNAMELRSVIVEESCSMRHIGDSLFHGCTALNAVVWDSPMSLPHEVFGEENYNNLLVYLPDTATVPASLIRDSYATLIQDGHSGPMTLDATASFYCPRSFTAEKVTYRRSFKQSTEIGASGGWEALTLPFDVQHITHATKGEITPFGRDGELHCWLATPKGGTFIESTEILANIPYIISMPNSDAYGDFSVAGSIAFSAENALIHATESTKKEVSPASEGSNRATIMLYFTPTYDFIEASNATFALNVGYNHNSHAPGSVFVPGRFTTPPFSGCMIADGDILESPIFCIDIASNDKHEEDNEDDADITKAFTAVSRGNHIYITCSEERVARLYDSVGRILCSIACKAGTTEVGPLDKGLYIIEGTKVYVER